VGGVPTERTGRPGVVEELLGPVLRLVHLEPQPGHDVRLARIVDVDDPGGSDRAVGSEREAVAEQVTELVDFEEVVMPVADERLRGLRDRGLRPQQLAEQVDLGTRAAVLDLGHVVDPETGLVEDAVLVERALVRDVHRVAV
jgi:hypothetical protein